MKSIANFIKMSRTTFSNLHKKLFVYEGIIVSRKIFHLHNSHNLAFNIPHKNLCTDKEITFTIYHI